LTLTGSTLLFGIMVRATGANAVAMSVLEGGYINQGTGHFESAGLDGVIEAQRSVFTSSLTATAYCLAANGFGFLAHPPRSQSQYGAFGVWGLDGFRVKGCTTGISASSPVLIVLGGGTVIDTATTGLEVMTGGTINLRGGVPTFTAVTNELSLEGTFYTSAFFNTLSPTAMSGPFGSKFINQ
jgi:hypothetical protein